MKKSPLTLLHLVPLLLAACAAAPSKKTITQEFLSGQLPSTMTASKIEKALTLGDNQMGAGYSVEATMITNPLISAEESEKGKANMDSEEKIKAEIEKVEKAFTKTESCFRFNVHTSTIHQAEFKNWVGKIKDSSGKLEEIVFTNVSGVQSVPTTYKDINGRRWHNFSYGCTTKKIDTTKPFILYMIPQIKTNQDLDETSTLFWDIK